MDKKETQSKSFDLDSFLKDINTKKQEDEKSFIQCKSDQQPTIPKDHSSTDQSSKLKQSHLDTFTKEKPEIKIVDKEERKIESKAKLERNHRIVPGCKFCDIIHHKAEKIIFEDDICAAFHDKHLINSQGHILVCSKSHIKNSHCVEKDNISLLTHLQDAGEALLKKRRPNDKYRFGYHEPPMNSIDHLHLHCIVLPITSDYLDKVIYGFKLTPTAKIIAKILSGEITPGVYPEKVKKTKKK